ncbi:MAG: hypothetical protein DRP45_12395 [Candidatus Zixiibacteriota bacterium]|nr:MAG: hypothetical protein DRP45_12395 [candidate division Zixibacteria bacterium]
MKVRFVYIILTISIVVCFAARSNATYTESEIALATDYAMSGLHEEAKQVLIPLLHDSLEVNLDPRIRYILGSICLFEEENIGCADYHWNRVLIETPNAPVADAIRDIKRAHDFFHSATIRRWTEDILFDDEVSTFFRFWTYKPPDWKMKWDDLKDARVALGYLGILLTRHPQDDKRAHLLWYKFLLHAGYNEEGFGYMHRPQVKEYNKENRHLLVCEAISDSLHQIPTTEDYYVRTQFLMGVMTSGSKFLSSKLKVNKKSAKYFEQVIECTEGQITNPYRIFASMWLREYNK